jgi:hypothetical protein
MRISKRVRVWRFRVKPRERGRGQRLPFFAHLRRTSHSITTRLPPDYHFEAVPLPIIDRLRAARVA